MKTHIRSGLLLLALAGAAHAAPATATAAAPDKKPGGLEAGGTSEVIGSQEAPGVSNIVPWKDKPSRLPKKEVTTSILRETLQPLDPEVLRREIDLQKRLGEAP